VPAQLWQSLQLRSQVTSNSVYAHSINVAAVPMASSIYANLRFSDMAARFPRRQHLPSAVDWSSSSTIEACMDSQQASIGPLHLKTAQFNSFCASVALSTAAQGVLLLKPLS
jgi:hypothetical protein